MNFRLWFESERMRPFLKGLEDAQDIGAFDHLLVMADHLEEEGEEGARDTINFIRKGIEWFRNDGGERETLDEIHALQQKKYEELRKYPIYISSHSNEVIDARDGQADSTQYIWYGNNIRVIYPHPVGGSQKPKTITIDEIKDPLILDALTFLAAEKVFRAWRTRAGLNLPRNSRNRVSAEGHKKEAEYFQNKMDSLLRSHLEPFLFSFTQAEHDLAETIRLQRNWRVVQSLEGRMRSNFGLDREAIMRTIERHLARYHSTFLVELAQRIDTFLQTLGQRYPNLVNAPTSILYRDVAQLIRERQK